MQIKSRTKCPVCGATDFDVHCGSDLCAWLVCNSCKTVWDYASDRQFTPPPRSSTR